MDQWIQKLEIGDDFRIESIENLVYRLFVSKNGMELNIADVGYGFSQLLPVLMQIMISSSKNHLGSSVVYRRSIILIEEPESNLHPNLQSKVAEMLMDAADRFNIQFIIETHSEYIIRKLQYLTAKKIIKPDDTVIYYFNPEKNQKDNVAEKIHIREDGRLSQPFGPGFYDEATRLMISIFDDENIN